METTHAYTKLGGAFYVDPSKAYAGFGHVTGDLQGTVMFGAQKSNSKYGSSNTIQPSAFQILIIIKVWKAGDCNFVPEYNEDDRLAEKLA